MPKCCSCKKLIPPLMKDIYRCRCKKLFCKLHLHDHNCTFDYKEKFITTIKKSIVKIEKEKINKI